MQKNLTFINIVPVFPGNEAFTISEIRRQYRETGLRQFAMCLSYHPQRTPAQRLIPELCRTFAAIRDGVRDLADLDPLCHGLERRPVLPGGLVGQT